MKLLILYLISTAALADQINDGWYNDFQMRHIAQEQLEVQRDIERDLRNQQHEMERQERDQFYNRLSEEHREFIREHAWKPE